MYQINVIAVFNHFLFALILLLLPGIKNIANKLLAAQLVAFGTIHFLGLFFYFGNTNVFFQVRGIEYVMGFAYGPLMYLYVYVYLYEHIKTGIHFWKHFIISLCFIIDFLVRHILNYQNGFAVPPVSESILSRYFYIFDFFVFVQWVFYLTLSVRNFRSVLKKMKYRKTRELKWIRIYLISTFGFIVTGPVMGFIDNGYTYGKFVAVFSLVYFTVLVWQSVATSRVFGSDYTVFKADRTNPDELAEILGIIEARKMFIQKDFSLEQFSYFLNKPKQEINSLFKQNLQINFTEYINQIRVKESISMLQSEKFDHYKVDAIGLEAGFSSRSSFYEAFKKETGLTPSEFRNQTRELKN